MEEKKEMEIDELGQYDIYNDFLATLYECQEICQIAINHSLEEGGDFVKREHIRWLSDTIEITKITSGYFIRDSEYSADLINLCGYVCEDCADSCEQFFEDETMKVCAEVCRNCSSLCQDILGNNEEECCDEESEEEAEESSPKQPEPNPDRQDKK